MKDCGKKASECPLVACKKCRANRFLCYTGVCVHSSNRMKEPCKSCAAQEANNA
ncbi:MAG: hypothetical protein Pg6C_17960 [Treponemataceae bacterium]|nr:MAG: hypothetical protein Pg6C_17960 [Treponemataceae bacterium]